jgi:WD40 repeat protein
MFRAAFSTLDGSAALPRGRVSSPQHDAFISYRRGDGGTVAQWLRRRLQTYRPPKKLRRRTTPLDIYLDTSFETATTDFYETNIRPALAASRHLIVIATPSTLLPREDGKENWVVREIGDFPLRPKILVAAGATMPDARLPGALEREFPNIERVDLRAAGRTNALAFGARARRHEEFLKIAAPLWDIASSEMPELREEEAKRRLWRLTAVLASTVALLIVVSALLVWGMVNLASSRRQLAANHLARGRDAVNDAPDEARLHFARALAIAEETRLPWLRLPAEAAAARAWLGAHFRNGPTRILQHPDDVRWARFDPSSRRLATAGADGVVRLWNRDGTLAAQSPAQEGAVTWVAFDRTGTRIAFATEGRSAGISIWDPPSGGVRVAARGELLSPQYGPGHDDVIALEDPSKRLRVWQIDTGFRGPPIAVDLQQVLKFSPDASRAAVLGEGTLTLWEVRSGKRIATLPCAPLVTVIAFSGDGRRIALPVSEHDVQLFDTTTGAAIGALLHVPRLLSYAALDWEGTRAAMVWNADDNVSPQPHQEWLSIRDVASGAYLIPPQQTMGLMKEPVMLARSNAAITLTSSEVRRWDLASGLSIARPAADPSIDLFVDEGHGIAGVAHLAGGVELLDLTTLAPLRPRMQHGDRADVVRISPDGTMAATYGADRTVRLAAIRQQPRVTLLQPAVDVLGVTNADAIVDAAFRRDGRSIAVASGHGVRLWMEGGAPRRITNCAALDVEFAAGGRIAVACGDGGAWLFERDGSRPRAVVRGNVKRVLFTPDGKRLLTCGASVSLRDIERGTVAVALQHPSGAINAAMSRDGRTIATIDEQRIVRTWDAASGRLVVSLPRIESGYAIEFSSDGRLLATSGRAARVWDAKSGKPVTEPLRNPNAFQSIAFSPDGTRLLTGGLNSTAQMWSIATSRGDGPPLSDPGAVWAVGFSPDGARMFTATFEHRVTLWDAAAKVPMLPPLSLDGSVLAARFDDAGKRIVAGTTFGQVVVWDVAPARESAAALRLAAEGDSGRTIDEETGLVRLLSRAEWDARVIRGSGSSSAVPR